MTQDPASAADPLSQFNLMQNDVRECPFPYFAAMRELDKPVYFMPELGMFYVSRYADLRFVKKHPELFSNNIFEMSDQGQVRDAAEEYKAKHGWARVSTLQRTDPPVHTKYRRLINDAFTVARIRQMTNYVETAVNDLIDAFIDPQQATGQFDFVKQFSVPLPCMVIADQLGVPREKIWDLKKWSDAMLAPGGGFLSEAESLQCAQQVVEAQQFFAQVIAERRAQPQDDIISTLVHAKVRDSEHGPERELDMFELQDLLDQLLTGGNETTTNAIGSAMMLLLQRPEQLARLRADPSLIRNFIEESLRFETPVVHLFRVATQDTEINGVAIPQGARLAVGYAAANRDEDVFEQGETFDIERKKAGAHLAFGSGPHHCVGAALARQEMYSAFTVLLHRLDNFQTVDPQESFAHVPSSFLRGLAQLPLTFTLRQRERYFPDACVY